MLEHVKKDGKVYALACGPLVKPRYVNPRLEKELQEFLQEVEGKFSRGETPKYVYPRRQIVFSSLDGSEVKRDGSITAAELRKEESKSPDRVEQTSGMMLRHIMQNVVAPTLARGLKSKRRRYLEKLNKIVESSTLGEP
jgi:hypothetical protein